jgi:hypothetical protein
VQLSREGRSQAALCEVTADDNIKVHSGAQS